MAVTLSMTYTEALFTAFAAWALVSVLERHWVEAGCCAVAAGLVRPTATVLVAVVCLAALAALRSERRWEVVVGGLLAPLGLLGYWGYVALRTGKVGGWWQIQREGWNSRFDWGVSSFEFATRILADGKVGMDLLIVLILLGGRPHRHQGAERAGAVAAGRVRGGNRGGDDRVGRDDGVEAADAGARVRAADPDRGGPGGAVEGGGVDGHLRPVRFLVQRVQPHGLGLHDLVLADHQARV